jgi:hypothetical protein
METAHRLVSKPQSALLFPCGDFSYQMVQTQDVF